MNSAKETEEIINVARACSVEGNLELALIVYESALARIALRLQTPSPQAISRRLEEVCVFMQLKSNCNF